MVKFIALCLCVLCALLCHHGLCQADIAASASSASFPPEPPPVARVRRMPAQYFDELSADPPGLTLPSMISIPKPPPPPFVMPPPPPVNKMHRPPPLKNTGPVVEELPQLKKMPPLKPPCYIDEDWGDGPAMQEELATRGPPAEIAKRYTPPWAKTRHEY